MHDLLFERQWALDDEHLVEYAEALGLDSQEPRLAVGLEPQAAGGQHTT